jgi:hypothetical protein
VAHPGDGPEGAVGVDQAQRVEAGVHELAAADQVAGRPDAQRRDQRGEGDHGALLPAGRGGQGDRRVDGQDGAEQGVVEGGRGQHDGDQVEPGEVAADQQPGLGGDDDQPGHPGHRLGGEQAERHQQLGGVVGQRLGPVQGPRQVVEEPAQGAGQRLGLVVVVEAGEVTPAAVAAQLDQPGPELDPEQQPAVQPQHQGGRGGPGRPEEDGQEPGLQQQRLPPEAVERLADVDHREVEAPEGQPDQHRHPGRPLLGQAGQGRRGQRHPRPGDHRQEPVRVVEVEEARRPAGRDGGQEPRRRQQAPLPQQRPELVGRDQEGDQVDGGQPPLEEEAAQPVVG